MELSKVLLGFYDTDESTKEQLPLASLEEAISCLRRQLDLVLQLPEYVTPDLPVSDLRKQTLLLLILALQQRTASDQTSNEEATQLLQELLAMGESRDEDRQGLLRICE